MASPLPSDPRGQRIGQRQNQQRPGNHRAVGPEEPHDDGQGDGRQHDSVVPRPPGVQQTRQHLPLHHHDEKPACGKTHRRHGLPRVHEEHTGCTQRAGHGMSVLAHHFPLHPGPALHCFPGCERRSDRTSNRERRDEVADGYHGQLTAAMTVRLTRVKTVTEPRCRKRQISFAKPCCSRRAAAAVATIQAPSTTDPTHNAGRYATGYVTTNQAQGAAATRYATAAMRVARAGPYRTAVVVLPPAASLSTSRMSFTNISARPM